jgi:hypothetical protein
VQDEYHVLLECSQTAAARRGLYPEDDCPRTLIELFGRDDQEKVAELCRDVLIVCEQ